MSRGQLLLLLVSGPLFHLSSLTHYQHMRYHCPLTANIATNHKCRQAVKASPITTHQHTKITIVADKNIVLSLGGNSGHNSAHCSVMNHGRGFNNSNNQKSSIGGGCRSVGSRQPLSRKKLKSKKFPENGRNLILCSSVELMFDQLFELITNKFCLYPLCYSS